MNQMDIKLPGPKLKLRKGEYGGNRKLQTFRYCNFCDQLFGPLNNLSRKFCSYKCKVDAQTTGRKIFRKTITKARSAQSLLAYHVKAGNIIKPSICEECGIKNKKIEAAHYNYDEPLRVKWLCRACHVRWDKQNPKNATFIVKDGKILQGRRRS